VESCATGADGAKNGTCTVNDSSSPFFCGYHSYVSSASPTIYADLPFPIYDSETGKACSSQAESPNGELDADIEVSTLSGEISGAITDPEGSAWYDAHGNEIDADCRYSYGNVLGGVTPGGLYNQSINGARYFIQEELSNEDYRYLRGHACTQRVDLPIASFAVKLRSPIVFVPATFNAKKSKGSIASYAWDFGDNKSGSGVRIRHTYVYPGTYRVTLTVTDGAGLQDTTSTTSETITVRS
jgi:PKD repeat protein